MGEGFPDLGRNAFGIGRGRSFPGQDFQRLLRRLARDGDLVGILVGQVIKAEAAALHNLRGPGHRLGIAAEQPRHFRGRLEVAVRMALAREPGLVDGGVVADAGHHILQDTPVMGVEQHVIGHDRWHPRLMGQVRQFIQPHLVFGAAQQGERQIGPVGKGVFQLAQMQRAGIICRVRDHDDD
ncbi:hypothetical protein GLUCOINTEAF2_0204086 [Komagataeibacter intermedius AF2]|uniref:Uncharacterized protein n=1 Tax=Komagataeibacter intermedius AF2 TaxID=1458464 RepID=A0A0N0MGB2_9PROT|nr:hypothetical protein GLUCOINTEAF2_0204086 [Komagataeibacter intermedius AF2]